MPQKTRLIKSTTPMARGNLALREGKYSDAIACYEEALKQTPELEKLITANLILAKKKIKKTGVKDTSKSVKHITLPSEKSVATQQANSNKKMAVVVHYFYPEIWVEIKEKISALPSEFALFVTIPIDIAEAATRDVLTAFPKARIHIGPNIGMDIIPFLSLIPILSNEGYYAVCKIQTKKGDGHLATIWRDVMLESLIGSSENFTRVIDAFLSDDALCLVGPAALYQSGQRLMYDNAENLKKILDITYKSNLPTEDWGFFAGTMFWSRVDVLEKVAKLANFSHESLDGEYKKDGKFEHALERFFGLLPTLHEGKVGLLQPMSGQHKQCEIVICSPTASIGQAHIGDIMRQLLRIDIDKEEIKNSKYFCKAYYISQNKELAGKTVDLIYHYLTQGCHQGKLPHPKFTIYDEILSYLKEKGDERNPLLFFIEFNGDDQNILSRINRSPIVFDKDFVQKTGLFDCDFYTQQFTGNLKLNEDPLDHYFKKGTFNELYPNSYFIPREYRSLHTDVVNAGFEPFYHYLKVGALEGRQYRSSKWREEEETPFFRYMVLNNTLIDWPSLMDRKNIKGLTSIVIPIYGQLQLTQNCLTSILNASTKQPYEIICVDNGSGDEISALLSEFTLRDKRIHSIRNKENYNFALGCNIGFQASRGEYIVFLNNDTTVTNDWLDELIQPLENPQVVAVQPKLIYPDKKIQNVGVVFAPKQTLGYPIYADFDSEDACANISRNYQAITAACMAIRSVDFAKAKGFDPIFINGQEDIDLCLRLTNGTGRTCRYQASSTVVHHESKTPGRGKYIKLNRKSFTKRWRDRIEPDDFKYYAEDKFRITKWKKDNDEMVKAGLGISRPILEKTKVSTAYFVWDTSKEQITKAKIHDFYSKNKELYKTKLVSIVMPTFNRAKVIVKAIESVLQQTHQNFELHICDDGSTDETHNLLARYLDDSRIKFHQLDHKGVSGARNKGLEFAQGELIAYLDSDNTWDKDFIKTMLVVMHKGSLDAAYCAIHAKDDNGKTVCYRGDIFDWNECLKENYIDMNAFVHTRTNVRFDEKLKRLVDWDFILRVTKLARVAYIPYLGVNYYDGNQFLRITQNEYIGNKLAEMQDFIRAKHAGDSSDDSTNANNDIDIEKFLHGDHKSPAATENSQSLKDLTSIIHRSLRFRIKIGCPSLTVSHEWGDYHFANAMKRSLEKLGHQCAVDCLDQWESVESLTADIVIVLRGLSRYRPRQEQVNLMWNISHPDKISLDEYKEYDHIFVASIPYAQKLQKQLTTPVSTLLQCTDPTLFNPLVKNKKIHEVLFVGNSRNVYREIVKDAIKADLPISVYGTRWAQFIPKKYIAGEHIRNEELAGYYASSGIVLNDHWGSMREHGFLSNRLFDAIASGALVVSDEIEGLNDIFSDYVVTYKSTGDLREIYENYSSKKSIAQQKEAAEIICSKHSFDARISLIESFSKKILETKKAFIHEQNSTF